MKVLLKITAVALMLVGFVFVLVPHVASADAPSGCYVKTGGAYTQINDFECRGEKITVNGETITANPPSDGRCYYKIGGTSGTPGAGSFQVVSCKTVESAGAPESISNPPGEVIASSCAKGSDCGIIAKYANPFIAFMSAIVGIVAVISIISAGIMYSASSGDPQKASAAKMRIRDTIIGLVAYLFLYAAVNFLVPGGII